MFKLDAGKNLSSITKRLLVEVTVYEKRLNNLVKDRLVDLVLGSRVDYMAP